MPSADMTQVKAYVPSCHLSKAQEKRPGASNGEIIREAIRYWLASVMLDEKPLSVIDGGRPDALQQASAPDLEAEYLALIEQQRRQRNAS